MLRMGGGQSVHGTIAEKEEPGCPAPWPHPQPPLPPSPAPSVTSSAAGASAGPGVCGWLLIAASWLLVLVTLPFSLCVCFKVVFPPSSIFPTPAVSRLCRSTREPSSSGWAGS